MKEFKDLITEVFAYIVAIGIIAFIILLLNIHGNILVNKLPILNTIKSAFFISLINLILIDGSSL